MILTDLILNVLRVGTRKGHIIYSQEKFIFSFPDWRMGGFKFCFLCLTILWFGKSFETYRSIWIFPETIDADF